MSSYRCEVCGDGYCPGCEPYGHWLPGDDDDDEPAERDDRDFDRWRDTRGPVGPTGMSIQ